MIKITAAARVFALLALAHAPGARGDVRLASNIPDDPGVIKRDTVPKDWIDEDINFGHLRGHKKNP